MLNQLAPRLFENDFLYLLIDFIMPSAPTVHTMQDTTELNVYRLPILLFT